MTVEFATICHEPTRTRAKVLVGFGFNCYELLTTFRDETTDLLWAVDGFRTGRERPSGSGIPILFPFPGRIKDARFQWQKTTFDLPTGDGGDGLGNAIHGFVHNRPWRVVDHGEDSITAQFQPSVQDPTILDHWPADFCITVTHRVGPHRLETLFHVENCDHVALPCGLGAHPYFRLPAAPHGAPTDCEVRLPVTAEWKLEELNATGEVVDLCNATELQNGFRLGAQEFDNVFTRLITDNGTCEASMIDVASRRGIRIRFTDGFRECVVYTPPHREALCIEPYTSVPDSIRLEHEGFNTGLRVLEPGATFEETMLIEMFD